MTDTNARLPKLILNVTKTLLVFVLWCSAMLFDVWLKLTPRATSLLQVKMTGVEAPIPVSIVLEPVKC
jgi:hypothetical protein